MRYSVILELSDELKDNLAKVNKQLKSEHPEVSWLEKDQLYLTTFFLGGAFGKVRKKMSQSLKEIALNSAKLNLELTSLDCFPEKGPIRTLYASLEDHSIARPTMFEHLISETKRSFAKLDIKPDENFKPHIVLGRASSRPGKESLRKDLKAFFENELSHQKLTLNSTCICILESKLSKSGPDYSIVSKEEFKANIAS